MEPRVTDSVAVSISAPKEVVWELISDVTRIGRYSPETFEAQWLGGANGPAVGAKFRGHVKRNQKGPTYWTTCEVTECIPGERFAFAVGSAAKPFNSWGYIISGEGESCTLTEWYRLPNTFAVRLYWALLGPFRSKTNGRGMLATLNAIKAEVENSR